MGWEGKRKLELGKGARMVVVVVKRRVFLKNVFYIGGTYSKMHTYYCIAYYMCY